MGIGTSLAPGLTFAAAVAGIFGIYCEFIWPGKVWPGAIGSIFLIFGAYALSRYPLSRHALALLCLSLLLFLIETFWETHWVAGVTGIATLAAGSLTLIRTPQTMSPWVASFLSVILGLVTTYLANGAKQARRNKRVDIER